MASRLGYILLGVGAASAALALIAQPTVTVLSPVPLNLDFADGQVGSVPTHWEVPAILSADHYAAELRRDGCNSNIGCVVITPPANPRRVNMITQIFDATNYRGVSFQFKASVKIDAVQPTDRAQLWVRVVRPNGQPGFFNNMGDHPVQSGNWQACVINGKVDVDAQAIILGLLSVGKGRAWIDDVSFTTVPTEAAQTTETASIPLSSAPANLSFKAGVGTPSSGWFIPAAVQRTGYQTRVRRDGCHDGQQCAVLESTQSEGTDPGNLMQRFRADPYKGKAIKVRAWLRSESTDPKSDVELWMRVDRKGGLSDLFDTSDIPLNPGSWQLRELTGVINADADSISFGVFSRGAKRVWIDSASLETVRLEALPPETLTFNFQESEGRKTPNGWLQAPASLAAGYSVEVRHEGCNGSGPCASIMPPTAHPATTGWGNLMHSLDAVSRQGQRFRLKALMRLDVLSSEARSEMWIGIDRKDGTRGFVKRGIPGL
jgi:hypothetical protein